MERLTRGMDSQMGTRRAITKPPNVRRPTRPPRLRTPARLPRGPQLYYVPIGADRGSTILPPPPGFVTPTTSVTEWFVYFALSRVLGYPKDPRRPPYVGWPGLWGFQANFEGGRHRRGGQVLDFLVEPGSYSRQSGGIAIRIQTEYYHVYTDGRTHALENILESRLARHYEVRDLWDQEFVRDPTGEAAVLAVKQVLSGQRQANPVRTRTAIRPRGLLPR